MESKNQLINPEWVVRAKEIIPQLSPEEKAVTWFACEQIENVIKQEVRKELLKGTVDKFEFNYNGVPISVQISRGKETIREVATKVIDYDKAIAFAKEHNFEIPMTERVVIEPMVDKSKLEMMDWFQNHCEEFVTVKHDVKSTKSYDRIITKVAK